MRWFRRGFCRGAINQFKSSAHAQMNKKMTVWFEVRHNPFGAPPEPRDSLSKNRACQFGHTRAGLALPARHKSVDDSTFEPRAMQSHNRFNFGKLRHATIIRAKKKKGAAGESPRLPIRPGSSARCWPAVTGRVTPVRVVRCPCKPIAVTFRGRRADKCADSAFRSLRNTSQVAQSSRRHQRRESEEGHLFAAEHHAAVRDTSTLKNCD